MAVATRFSWHHGVVQRVPARACQTAGQSDAGSFSSVVLLESQRTLKPHPARFASHPQLAHRSSQQGQHKETDNDCLTSANKCLLRSWCIACSCSCSCFNLFAPGLSLQDVMCLSQDKKCLSKLFSFSSHRSNLKS